MFLSSLPSSPSFPFLLPSSPIFHLSQTLSLSCLAGSTVTRAVPLKNAGNVPILVKLKTSEKAAHFSVYPEVLHLEVNQVGGGPNSRLTIASLC